MPTSPFSHDGVSLAATGSVTTLNTIGMPEPCSAFLATCDTGVVIVSISLGLPACSLAIICGSRVESKLVWLSSYTTSLPSMKPWRVSSFLKPSTDSLSCG